MSYLLSGQPSENERLQLQSRVWEPAGRRLVAEVAPHLADPAGEAQRSAVDVGCGALGWLRVLAEWAGPGGEVVGTDIDPAMLALATAFVAAEGLRGVRVRRDDLFDSRLPAGGFDLVHARFQIAPLGRAKAQLAAYLRLCRPGGALVIEDPDSASWHYTPDAPHTQQLIGLVRKTFAASGGDFDAGRHTADLMRDAGLDPQVRAEVVALPPGHPYLRLPAQFATSLRPRLEQLVDPAELDALMASSSAELDEPGRSGLTFTLMQTWALVPA